MLQCERVSSATVIWLLSFRLAAVTGDDMRSDAGTPLAVTDQEEVLAEGHLSVRYPDMHDSLKTRTSFLCRLTEDALTCFRAKYFRRPRDWGKSPYKDLTISRSEVQGVDVGDAGVRIITGRRTITLAPVDVGQSVDPMGFARWVELLRSWGAPPHLISTHPRIDPLP